MTTKLNTDQAASVCDALNALMPTTHDITAVQQELTWINSRGEVEPHLGATDDADVLFRLMSKLSGVIDNLQRVNRTLRDVGSQLVVGADPHYTLENGKVVESRDDLIQSWDAPPKPSKESKAHQAEMIRHAQHGGFDDAWVGFYNGKLFFAKKARAGLGGRLVFTLSNGGEILAYTRDVASIRH